MQMDIQDTLKIMLKGVVDHTEKAEIIEKSDNCKI